MVAYFKRLITRKQLYIFQYKTIWLNDQFLFLLGLSIIFQLELIELYFLNTFLNEKIKSQFISMDSLIEILRLFFD